MPLDPIDLSTLSRLLDEALDLEPLRVEAWLAALPDEHRHLLPRLRVMLAEHLAQGQAGFMSDGPKLDERGSPADESVAHADDLVGPYRLIREIGRGGMGAVWLAERADGGLKRLIALKLPRLAWGAGLAERMARERDIGALLEHPNIARLYDAGVDALGRPYLALEYIDGQPLDAWCEAKALSAAQRLRLFLQVARAVAYAHGRLVVHRDLKPSNVLVTADGQAHLLDFGIAKLLREASPGDERLTQEQGRVLTPHYASPEQIRGESITVQSDVYSLGVLLYELLTGHYPHVPERKGLAALEEAILSDETPPASGRTQDRNTAKALRGEIDAVLGKALKREPSQRYATADAFAADIERHLNGDTVLAQPDSVNYRLTKLFTKHRVGFASASAILLAVLAGAGVSIVQARRANDAAERARVIKEFVVDVFKVNERGSAANSELRQLPAELLLERGARLIETKFPAQPQLQAELFGVVGGIFADMGANELAADYAARQIQALVAIGAGQVEQANATILLAQALWAQGRLRDAEVQARRAVSLAETDPALRPAALVLLAQVLAGEDQSEEAARTLDRAEQHMKSGTGPTAVGARAKALRAVLLLLANRSFDDAVTKYLEAIDEALGAEGRLSPAAIDIRLSLAHNLVISDRAQESRPHLEAALGALRAAGGPGDVRAALEESEIASEMLMSQQISFAEGRAAIERSRSSLAARGALVPDVIRAKVDLALGIAHLGWGNVQMADSLIATSAATLRPRLEANWDRSIVAAAEGQVALLAGRHDQAQALLLAAVEGRKLVGQGQDVFAADEYIFVAMNLSMQNRFDEARAVLASAPSIFVAWRGKKRPAERGTQDIRRTHARVLIASGDATAALSLLPPEGTDVDYEFPHDHLLLRGEVLCAVGRRPEGLAMLEKSLQVHESRDYEHAPWLARARAVTGLCAFADGQRERASELAALAHASFVAQPGVSPYFKAPSERLDRLLNRAVAQR